MKMTNGQMLSTYNINFIQKVKSKGNFYIFLSKSKGNF